MAVLALAGCGGGSSGAPSLTIRAAQRYELRTHGSALQILQPDGTPLTRFKRGAGPHTGVHVIFVRRDLHVLLHLHPHVRPNGSFVVNRSSLPPGPYRMVVDVYPAQQSPQPNFQLFETLRVPGRYRPTPVPSLQRSETVDGYTFRLRGMPKLRAIEPGFLSFTVTGPNGKPAAFTPWFGALAHAIFFRAGSVDYFHTHVCAPGAAGCTSVLGRTKVTGRSTTPGNLTVGALVPLSGKWRLFLQCRVAGRVLTAPFTLEVR